MWTIVGGVVLVLIVADVAVRSNRRADALEKEVQSLRGFLQLAEERIFALQDDVARLSGTSRTEQPSVRQPPRGFLR